MAYESSSPKNPIALVAFASTIGTTIEWYDFFLYGVLTPLVFNKLFFPTFNPLVGTLLAYTTFAIGFVARPVGGVIFGHYGDRIGRKTMLILTLSIMGAGTFLIGLLPGYALLGVWSPILLLVLRILQGIGIGGEWGGAVLMAVEHSPSNRRGFYGSWPQIGVPAGLGLSTGIVALLSRLGPVAFLSVGWRIAFLVSAVLVLIGLYIRLRIFETPAFRRIAATGTQARIPFVELMRKHSRNVLLGMGARFAEGMAFNTYGVFAIGYLTNDLKLPGSVALLGVMVASLVMIPFIMIWGRLSDTAGRRKVFGAGALLTAVLAIPAFVLMNATRETWLIWLAIVIPFGIVYPLMYGPESTLFSELFDTRVRYSGVSFVYQFSGIFASGLTPLVLTALLAAGHGQPWLIVSYMIVVSLISLLSVYLIKDLASRDLEYDEVAHGAAAAPQPTSV